MIQPSNFPEPYSHTTRFENVELSDILTNETIIVAGGATEVRGQLSLWNDIRTSGSNQLVSLIPIDNESVSVIIVGEDEYTLCLRDEQHLDQMTNKDRLLIDISGLPHNVWAPLLKSAHKQNIPTRVLYVEPESYKPHPSPASATLFDLSVDFLGLAPLPGFVRLSGPPDEDKCIFVAMLGFEGNRPERLVLQIDPTPKVIPVVGAPGFQLEFPAFTIVCNRVLLEDYRAHSELRYARASCPFEAYSQLEKIHKDYPDYYMYIAPVGTKPHSLGVIWYCLNNPTNTEIMFDYPIRKTGRTKGIGVIHIYDLGKLIDA